MHPIAFTLGNYPIRYAGLSYLLAIIVAWAYAARVARRNQWNPELVLPGVSVVVAATYLGARIHGAARDWPSFRADPVAQIVNSNSLSLFGGLILGSIVMLAFLRWTRLPVANITDELAPIAPVLYAIFRLGCFLNGDDYGVPTSLPWGLSFPFGSPPTFDRVHPVQLYEIALMVPIWLALRRSRPDSPDGARSFDLCVLLGTERFLVEFLRPGYGQADLLAGPQWFSLVLVAVGVIGRLRAGIGARRR